MEPWIENGLKLLGAALTAGLVALVVRPQTGRARREGGRRVLVFGTPYKAMFGAMALVGGFFTWFVIANYPADPEQRMWANIVVAMVAGIVAMLAYPLWWVELAYDDTALYVTNLRHRNRRIPWHDVRAARWSETWQGYYLVTGGHGRVWFWKMQVGHEELFDLARAKTGGRQDDITPAQR